MRDERFHTYWLDLLRNGHMRGTLIAPPHLLSNYENAGGLRRGEIHGSDLISGLQALHRE